MGGSTAVQPAIDKAVKRIKFGLTNPNPGIARVQPITGVMASLPTITAGAPSGSTQITNSVLISSLTDTTVFTYGGCKAGVTSPFDSNQLLAPENFWAYDGSKTIRVPSTWWVEFEFDGSALEFLMRGTGSGKQRMEVVGQGFDALAPRQDTAANGNFYLIKYDFGSNANRTIRFEMNASCHFGGIRIGPNDTAWKTMVPTGPVVALFGDSFAEGSLAGYEMGTFGHHIARSLGWRNMHVSGLGATGYVNPATGGKVIFGARMDKDIVAYNPDIVIATGGLNDQGYNGGVDYPTAYAAMLSCFQTIKAGASNPILIVCSPFWPNGNPGSVLLGLRDAAKQAAIDAHAALFIDSIKTLTATTNTLGYMTGTGRVGTTTGSGNADIYTSSDNTHPTTAGHAYLGRRIAQEIAAASSAGAF